MVAGKNLNDDQWHTIKFARFANNIKLQLDSYSPIRGALIDTCKLVSFQIAFLNNLSTDSLFIYNQSLTSNLSYQNDLKI